jgi:hypothetical protein
LEQAEMVVQVTAPMMQLREIPAHLAAALLFRLCPLVEVEDVITRRVVNQIVAAEVAVVDQVGTAALKPFTMAQQVLLGKDIQADLGCIITELQQEHIMAEVVAVAQELWDTAAAIEINKAAAAKAWLQTLEAVLPGGVAVAAVVITHPVTE